MRKYVQATIPIDLNLRSYKEFGSTSFEPKYMLEYIMKFIVIDCNFL
jgi:hypothetical protein